MKKSYYLPRTDTEKDVFLTHLNSALPGHATALELDEAVATDLDVDQKYWHWVLASAEKAQAYAQAWTAYKNDVRDSKATVLGDLPTPPNFGTAPDPAPPGIFNRVTTLVGRIKKSPGYTETIGQDLNIIGAEQTVDLDAMKPVITLKPAGGQLIVGWKKNGMDALEIHVDRGSGFVLLAVDTVPDYTDTQPLPATSAVWKYKAIYLFHGERVGQWSDVITQAVAA